MICSAWLLLSCVMHALQVLLSFVALLNSYSHYHCLRALPASRRFIMLDTTSTKEEHAAAFSSKFGGKATVVEEFNPSISCNNHQQLAATIIKVMFRRDGNPTVVKHESLLQMHKATVKLFGNETDPKTRKRRFVSAVSRAFHVHTKSWVLHLICEPWP